MVDSRSAAERILLWTGHLFFGVLIVSCIVFYQERLLAFDTAYYMFHILAYDEFFIKHDRYVSYLTQWVPLWGMEQGWSLEWIMRSFSASFYLWFYLVFMLISHGFRSITGGTFLVATLSLGMRYKFFAAISEITFAMVLAALLLAWLAHRPKHLRLGVIDFGVVAVCLTGIFGAHVVVLYPIMTFLVFERLYNGRWKEWTSWIMPALIVVVFLIKFLAVQGDEYESDKMAVLFQPDIIRDVLLNPGDYFIYRALLDYFTLEYVPVMLLFLAGVGWLWRTRKIGSAVFISGAFLGWLFINLVVYSYLESSLYIMLDGYLAIFGMIWATPFYFIWRGNKTTTLAWVAVALIALSTGMMLSKKSFYKQRLEYIEQTLALHPEHEKLLVPASAFNWETMWYPYEVAHESLMLTALEGREQCRTIYVNIDAPADAEFLASDQFLQFHGSVPLKVFSYSRFFSLPEAPYTVVDTVAWK